MFAFPGGERAALMHLGVVDEQMLRFKRDAGQQWEALVRSGRVRCKLYQASMIVGTYGLPGDVFEALISDAAGEALLAQLAEAAAQG